MEIIGSSRFCFKLLQHGIICSTAQSSYYNLQQVRKSKHWIPKWKTLRRQKVVKIDLPNYQEKPEDISKEEMRSRLKEKGVLPSRPWLERPFHISCTGGIFEPYVPPEGDGKSSIITKEGAKQKFEFLEKKSKSLLAIRKIRSYDEDFETDKFVQVAQDLYIKAHQCICEKNKMELRECVTERSYPEMIHNISGKTIHWKFLRSLEPPRIVHARVTDIISKENLFGQITVRFHSQQLLAIYDRFGRLIHGSEIISKDVLEYVIFEKHISNEYGLWRLHDKIIPDWMPPKPPSIVTRKIANEIQVEQIEQIESVETTPKNESLLESGKV